MAYALVYQLTQLNTVHGPTFHIFACTDWGGDRPHFRVWVQRVQDSLQEL